MSTTSPRVLSVENRIHSGPSTTPSAPSTIRLRRATVDDGRSMWALAQGAVDDNSPYAYLMMCEYFGRDCVVAELDGDVVGFVTGFRPPEDPDAYFVWQIVVDPSTRGSGLGGHMLDACVQSGPRPARWLEATVTPDNEPSARLFRGFARRHDTHCDESLAFASSQFPPDAGPHEAEMRFRIGPLQMPAIDLVSGHTTDPRTSHNPTRTPMDAIETHESQVRSYCRSWPTTFRTGRGSVLTDTDGREYLDFFAGAGALNYGHNDPVLRDALVDYLTGDGVLHGLDMATEAKETFLDTFHRRILAPRGLDYLVQFTGPTGTNAVEAALKLARKVKGRHGIAGFTSGFHGMTLGSLAVTGNAMKRGGAGVPLTNAVNLPFAGYHGDDVDTIDQIRRLLDDRGSGVDRPAAVIVETVQGEGGLNTASAQWLRRLRRLCDDLDMLLVVDDIQVGCGRTGGFFSFEEAGITPDIVCLSKSISGFGLPMAITLIRPDLDVWEPGEHNGTFRGNNAAFVTGTAALERFWATDELERGTEAKAALVHDRLADIAEAHPGLFDEVRGRGLLQGLASPAGDIAEAICGRAFELGLLLETAGPDGEVTKLLPPLTITEDELGTGLDRLEQAIDDVLDREGQRLLEVAEEAR